MFEKTKEWFEKNKVKVVGAAALVGTVGVGVAAYNIGKKAGGDSEEAIPEFVPDIVKETKTEEIAKEVSVNEELEDLKNRFFNWQKSFPNDYKKRTFDMAFTDAENGNSVVFTDFCMGSYIDDMMDIYPLSNCGDVNFYDDRS